MIRRVAVIGGGLAGITAALQCLENNRMCTKNELK